MRVHESWNLLAGTGNIHVSFFFFPFQTEEQEQPLNRKRVVCYQLADEPLVIIKVKV